MTNYIDDLAEDIYEALHDHVSIPADEVALYRLYALLGLVKGTAVTRENVHDAWAVWQLATMPEHRSIRPFAELSPEVQALDAPYAGAINDVMQWYRVKR